MHGRVGGNSLAKKKGDDLFDLVDAVAKQPTLANTVVKKDKVQKRKTREINHLCSRDGLFHLCSRDGLFKRIFKRNKPSL